MLRRWIAWSAPVPFGVAGVYLLLNYPRSGMNANDAVAFVLGPMVTAALLLPPLAVALAGWVTLVRGHSRCATSRWWHAISLAALFASTACGYVLTGTTFLLVLSAEPTSVLEALRSASIDGGMSRATHWLEYIASPVLVVVFPRLMLARHLREAELVMYR